MSSPQPAPAEPAEPTVDELLALELAERLGVDDPDAKLLRFIRRALDDAESDVEGYLGRPIRPRVFTQPGVWPDLFGSATGWLLPVADPVRRIISATAETFLDNGVPVPVGTSTIVYEVGLDYLNDAELRPILRYVTAAALNNYELLNYVEAALHLRGPVTSVSVSTEGQSKTVNYGHLGYTPPASRSSGGPAADFPGSLPARSTLDRWRLAGRRVHQAPDQWYDWRIDGMGGRFRDRDGFWNQPL